MLRDIIVRLNTERSMTIFMNTHLPAKVTKTCTSIGILRAGELIYHDPLEPTLRLFPAQDAVEEIYLQSAHQWKCRVSVILTVVGQEIRSAFRERLAIALLMVSLGMTLVSAAIGWFSHHTVMSVYSGTVLQLARDIPNSFTNVSPLKW